MVGGQSGILRGAAADAWRATESRDLPATQRQCQGLCHRQHLLIIIYHEIYILTCATLEIIRDPGR